MDTGFSAVNPVFWPLNIYDEHLGLYKEFSIGLSAKSSWEMSLKRWKRTNGCVEWNELYFEDGEWVQWLRTPAALVQDPRLAFQHTHSDLQLSELQV